MEGLYYYCLNNSNKMELKYWDDFDRENWNYWIYLLENGKKKVKI